ncbi:uncharacterized protein LOC128671035 isoform X2 [Plodia interpunctella]|uniref:uncharacterized protein LOC128671035 isoform X2 n=1 Tax=Plodia interpunctella TaxID=58824 RepID=UPI002367713F|nr:uncharacterized protein LOC128671035 isoform X2 [Plodia interpunctella]
MLAAAANCASTPSHQLPTSTERIPSNSSCEKWKKFESNKVCLKKYIKHVLPKVKMSTAPANSTQDVPIAMNSSTPSTLETTPVITRRPVHTVTLPELDCLSLDNVKDHYSNNLKEHLTDKNLQIGQSVRLNLFDKALQQSKLKEFKNSDLQCIKNKTKELKDDCLVKFLKTTDSKALFRSISHTMSKLKSYNIKKETCDLSPTLIACVRRVLTICPNALELIASIQNVTSEMCKDILNPPQTIPISKGLSTVATVFIVIASVCGSIAVAYAVFKYLKIRRSSGKLNVNKENAEECEMTTISRPMN